jgi:hypothetical protein
MNSGCPSCGAVYVLATRHLGRRKKCKMCQTALVVTENGLKIDQSVAADPKFDDANAHDDGFVAKMRKAREHGRRLAAGFDSQGLLARIGGIPSLLFGIGIFLVVFTGFQEAIGRAKIERRVAQYSEAKVDHDKEIDTINGNKDLRESDRAERTKKETERWEKEEKSLKADQAASASANQRSGYVDKYVLMFGFLLIAFGCLGYLRAEFPVLLRVVAGVILTAMVLGLFKIAIGTAAGIDAGVRLG